METSSWAVRRAGTADARAIGELHVRSWRVGYRGVMPEHVLAGLDARERTGQWRETLATPGEHAVFVAVRDGAIGAFCAVGPVRDVERDAVAGVRTGEVLAMYADPAAYGTGAAAAAHGAGLAFLRAGGHRHLVLWVLAANPRARAFYERHGWWCDDGVEQDDYYAPGVKVVRYSRALAGS